MRSSCTRWCPTQNLRQTISERAHELARERIAPVADSMRLEAQGLTQKELAEQTDELVARTRTATERSMGADWIHAPGATPPHVGVSSGIEIPSVRTHGELNEVEAANIIRGQEWALRRPRMLLPGMLSDTFLQRLHAAMFG